MNNDESPQAKGLSADTAPPPPPDPLDAAIATEQENIAGQEAAAGGVSDGELSDDEVLALVSDLDSEPLCEMTLEELVAWMCPAWPVKDKLPRLAKLWARYVDKVAPALLAQHGELVIASVTTVIVFAPHIIRKTPRYLPGPADGEG